MYELTKKSTIYYLNSRLNEFYFIVYLEVEQLNYRKHLDG